jgi:hypothetical protein
VAIDEAGQYGGMAQVDEARGLRCRRLYLYVGADGYDSGLFHQDALIIQVAAGPDIQHVSGFDEGGLLAGGTWPNAIVRGRQRSVMPLESMIPCTQYERFQLEVGRFLGERRS